MTQDAKEIALRLSREQKPFLLNLPCERYYWSAIAISLWRLGLLDKSPDGYLLTPLGQAVRKILEKEND